MTIKGKEKKEVKLTAQEEAILKTMCENVEKQRIFLLPIIIIREGYLPETEDGRVTWLNTFSAGLTPLVGTLAAVTNTIATNAQADAAFYQYTVALSKAAANFAEELTAFKDKVTKAEQGTLLGAVPTFNPPAAVTARPAGIFTRITQLVESIKADPDYNEVIGHDLGIIGPENTIDTDTLTPNLKGKIVDGRFPNLKCAKAGMDAYNVYADYRDGQGMHWIARVTTFRRGFVDNHPIPANVDSAVWDYQAKYVYKDAEVGQLSAKVTITVTKTP